MLRWLTRLLWPQRTEAPGATPSAAPAPQPEVIALPTPEAGTEPADGEPVVVGAAGPPLERETCPDCGRASVFAGPPGHRYCMHCALRQELFDSKTASN